MTIIPYQHLSTAALHGLVEEFITREGTDYGWEEKALEEKVSLVMLQIQNGDIVIVFDPTTETTNLLTSNEC